MKAAARGRASLPSTGSAGWEGRAVIRRVGGLGLWRLAWLVAPLILTGCASLPPSAPFDLTEPGWTVRQGQALWRPPRGGMESAEIAGDLLVATHGDGRGLVQFIKPPLPFIGAQRTPDAWEIHFFAQKRYYHGRGQPPGRILWLHLAEALSGGPSGADWVLTRRSGGEWHFEQRKTGETLDGYLKTTTLPPTHVVRDGESLLGIANRYGISPQAIEAVNDGPPASWLKPGKALRLPPPR